MRASVAVAGAAIWTALVSFVAFSYGETTARARYEGEKAACAVKVEKNTIKQAAAAENVKKKVKNAVVQSKNKCAAILSYDLTECLRGAVRIQMLPDRIRKN